MAASSHYNFPDMSKYFQSFNFADLFGAVQPMFQPGLDPRPLFEVQQKNFEAMARAQQIMMEAGQALMQRQAEIMQSAVQEATKATRDIMADGDPQSNAGKRFDTARVAFEKNVGNMSELAELSSKATAEAMEIIRGRALAAFDEIRAAMEKATKSAPSPSGRGSGRGARD